MTAALGALRNKDEGGNGGGVSDCPGLLRWKGIGGFGVVFL